MIRPGRNRRLTGQRSLVSQILAFGPAQWLRFTSENVTLNAGNISAVTDLTPNARHATQGTASLQPQFDNPGADFDGTDDYLECGSAFLNGITGSSIFTVIDLAGETLDTNDCVYGLTNANYYALDFGALGGGSGVPAFGIQDAVTQRFAVGPASLSGATGRYLIDGRNTSGSARVWTNGVAGTETTAAWSGTAAANRNPAVGAQQSAGSIARPFPGTIVDVLVFTSALSVADQAAVRSLLARLEGITL